MSIRLMTELKEAAKHGDYSLQLDLDDELAQDLLKSSLDFEYADGYFFVSNNKRLKKLFDKYLAN